jgi:hypothetical protein
MFCFRRLSTAYSRQQRRECAHSPQTFAELHICNNAHLPCIPHFSVSSVQETTNLVERDSLSYRSYFLPVKGTVDGDLCETVSIAPCIMLREPKSHDAYNAY